MFNQILTDDLKQKIAQYVKDTDDLITDLTSEKKALTNKVASQEEQLSEQKQASERVAEGTIETTVDRLIAAGFLTKNAREQHIESMKADTAGSLLNFCDKLAGQRLGGSVPSLGNVVVEDKSQGSAHNLRESDRSFEASFS